MTLWTPRALLALGWYVIWIVPVVAFEITASGHRPYIWPLAHSSFLAISVFAIEGLTRFVPLARPYMAARIALHALFALVISAVSGLATATIMGKIDGLTGVQHLLNTLNWHMSVRNGRITLWIVEQFFYFGAAATFELSRRLEAARQSELHEAELRADLARLAVAAARSRIEPEYLRDVFASLSLSVARDAEETDRFIAELARFLRRSIDPAADESSIREAFDQLEATRGRVAEAS